MNFFSPRKLGWPNRISQFFKRLSGQDRQLLIAIAILALFIRLGFIATLDANSYHFSDTRHYDSAAISLLKGDGLGADYNREPLYPYVMAAIYFVFGHSFTAMRIFQALLGVLLVFIIHDLARMVFNRKVALWAALMTALYPYLIVFSGILYTEMLFTTLMAASIWFLVRASFKQFWVSAIFSGVFIGLAALCRPAIFFFVPFMLLWIIFRQRTNWLARFGFGAVILAAALAVLMPTLLGNYQKYHRLVLVRAIPHTILPKFSGNNYQAMTHETINKATNAYRLQHPFGSEHDNLWAELKHYIKHPLGALAYFVDELPHFWAPFPDRLDSKDQGYRDKIRARDTRMSQNNPLISQRIQIASYIFMLPIYFLALLGVFKSVFQSRQALLLLLPILSFTLGYCFIYAEVRYRIPVDPYMLTFAAFALVFIIEKIQKPKRMPISVPVRLPRPVQVEQYMLNP